MKKRPLYIATVFFILWIISIKLVDKNYTQIYKSFSEEEQYQIKAVIISDVDEKEYKKVYKIEIQEINGDKSHKGDKWLLNIRKAKNNKSYDLQYGDLIEFNGKVEIPSTARNYMGFDYQKYLKSKKIYGNITLTENMRIIAHNQNDLLSKILYKIRIDMKERVYRLLPEDAKELCIGILIGDRTDIDEEITKAFKASNLTHMLAISGAHISYIVLGISFLFSKLGNRICKIIIIIFLIFFMLLTGFTPSVQRASFMSIFMLLANLLYRKSNIFMNLFASSFIILMINPYAIFDIGFQLSYGGTIGIIILNPKISKTIYSKIGLEAEVSKYKGIGIIIIYFKKILKYVADMLVVTISANIIIIPIMVFQFNTISFTFWISNILAGPFLGMITILSFIMYFVSYISMQLANIASFPLEYIIKLLILIAKICSNLPLSSVIIRTPYVIEMILYYLGIFIACNWRNTMFFAKKLYHKMVRFYRNRIGNKIVRKRVHIRLISIILIMIIIFNSVVWIINQNRNLKIYFIDVGQGDCTLIRTPFNKMILIDGGGNENGSFDVGEQILFPYLLDRKITKIDYVMISHMDFDHIGALFYILENMKVGHVIISKQGEISKNYEKLKEIVDRKNIEIIIVKQGDRIKIDSQTYFDILFPTDYLIRENVLNNNSIVAKFCYKRFSILFTGDIEEIAEKQLVDKYSNSTNIHSTILKIAHHGSKTSSIQEFLQLVKPKIALIGVGEKNTFGHPNSNVLERLKDFRAKTYRTDLCGEIEIQVNDTGKVKIKTAIK